MNEVIKKRIIPFENNNNSESILDTLSRFKGIREKSIDSKGRLHISYNLLQINLEEIENDLKSAGFEFQNSHWHKFKMGWIAFTEKNEYDNMTAKVRDCCSIDDIERKVK